MACSPHDITRVARRHRLLPRHPAVKGRFAAEFFAPLHLHAPFGVTGRALSRKAESSTAKKWAERRASATSVTIQRGAR